MTCLFEFVIVKLGESSSQSLLGLLTVLVKWEQNNSLRNNNEGLFIRSFFTLQNYFNLCMENNDNY